MTDTKKGFFNSLPGFRSGKIAKKIIAVGLIYIPLIISLLGIIVYINNAFKEYKYDNIINAVICTIIVVLEILAVIAALIIEKKSSSKNKHAIEIITGFIFTILAFALFTAFNSFHTNEYNLYLENKKESKQAAVITELSTTAVSKKESITLASTAVSVKVTETEADAETELPKTSGAETKAETTTTVILQTEPTELQEKTEPTQYTWLRATGHLYTGVDLYLVMDTGEFLYGTIMDIDNDTDQVLLYTYENDTTQWVDRHAGMFLKSLYIRSDDDRLPQ